MRVSMLYCLNKILHYSKIVKKADKTTQKNQDQSSIYA